MNLYNHLTEEEYIKIQESRSGYIGDRDTSPWGTYFLKYYSDYIEEPILDIGCGIGSLLNVFREQGKFAIGLDISRGASRRAIEDGFLVVNQDVQKKLPFPDKVFKTIIMFHTLEHTFYPEKVIKNIHRILAPGGKLCTLTPLGNNFAKSKKGDPNHGHFSNILDAEYLESYFTDYKILVSDTKLSSKETTTVVDQGHFIIATPKE